MKCSYLHIFDTIILPIIIVTNVICYRNITNHLFITSSSVSDLNSGHFVKYRLYAGEDDIFVDTCKITVKAGDGGNGCLSFRREKHVPLGGPSGGSGGHGGNVYVLGDKALTNLYQIKMKTYFKASNGLNGKGSQRRGVCSYLCR